MNIFDGKKLAKQLGKELKYKINFLDFIPKFVSILVGNNSSSEVYIRQKQKKCVKLGIDFELIRLDSNITTEELIDTINNINNNKSIHGCIVQLPLPAHINNEVIYLIDPKKDVDGFTQQNLGNLIINKPSILPATPLGITKIIDYSGIETKGKNCVIIGKSNIVGTPMALIMANENGYGSTVTMCDKNTINLKNIVQNADILIVAAGKHHLINSTFKLKKSVSIIDVGIHRINDTSKKSGYRLEGDVDFNYFLDKCNFITPVPGGVGPMTVYALMSNIYETSVRQYQKLPLFHNSNCQMF